MSRDPRVDAYIARAAPFAQPILAHVRDIVHGAAPEIAETIKWSMPFFVHGGRPIANMAAFKAHAAFGFWQRDATADAGSREAMGEFGRLTCIADLPGEAVLANRVRAAIAAAAAGAPVRRAAGHKPPLATPYDLQLALDAAPAAAAGFAALTPGARREYVEWVTGARQPATRAKRIATTVEQVAAGRKLNWRYEKC